MANRPYRIVAALDGSDATDVVLAHAMDVAQRHEATQLHLIGVVPVGSGLLHRSRDHGGEVDELEGNLKVRIDDVLSAFDGSSVAAKLHVRAGEPAEEIVDLVEEAEADLVVLGRHGWGRRRRGFVGSVSERVMRLAPCSVLVARAPEYAARESSREVPCPACVRVRAETDGERWFCEAHTADDAHRRISSIRLSGAMPLKPGGLF